MPLEQSKARNGSEIKQLSGLQMSATTDNEMRERHSIGPNKPDKQKEIKKAAAN